jgi:hypothetical protein
VGAIHGGTAEQLPGIGYSEMGEEEGEAQLAGVHCHLFYMRFSGIGAN